MALFENIIDFIVDVINRRNWRIILGIIILCVVIYIFL